MIEYDDPHPAAPLSRAVAFLARSRGETRRAVHALCALTGHRFVSLREAYEHRVGASVDVARVWQGDGQRARELLEVLRRSFETKPHPLIAFDLAMPVGLCRDRARSHLSACEVIVLDFDAEGADGSVPRSAASASRGSDDSDAAWIECFGILSAAATRRLRARDARAAARDLAPELLRGLGA